MAQQFCGDPNIPHEGFVILQDEDGWFHATPDKEPVYPERYALVEHFQGKVAWVRKKNGVWIRIGKHGREVKNNSVNVSFTG
jgi:hypothetical protein